MGADRLEVRPWVAGAVVAAAVVLFGVIGALRLDDPVEESGPRPLRVPRFVSPESVIYDDGIVPAFDPPEVLARLRERESLDAVVVGAASAEERVRRLMAWTRAQFEPGRPDPYPPPDAALILSEIRAGRTGGFCAQYCFILVQAGGSLGIPTRLATIVGHEVTEAWLCDEQRWTMVDPHYSLQVLDAEGRSLSAIEVRRARAEGRELRLSDGHTYPGPENEYLERFRELAVWARNDFISRPLNFADFDRCRVWIEPVPGVLPEGGLTSLDGAELYRPPPIGAECGDSSEGAGGP